MKNKDEIIEFSFMGFQVVIFAIILVLYMSSCRTSGYGCKGKESWNQMVKRINKPY